MVAVSSCCSSSRRRETQERVSGEGGEEDLGGEGRGGEDKLMDIPREREIPCPLT